MKSSRPDRLIFRAWLGLFPLSLVLWYFPVIDFETRLATAAAALLILLGAIYFSRKNRLACLLITILPVAAFAFLTLPSHGTVDRRALRAQYCESLRSYLGCRYVWGGETITGIDCSGFVRKGLEDALFARGLKTLNSTLVRESIWLYWHDTTAKVIGDGYAGKTSQVAVCKNLNLIEPGMLQPGDMAVTSTGNHVMACLGNGLWIAADPEPGKVVIFQTPNHISVYFDEPMRIIRWRILED